MPIFPRRTIQKILNENRNVFSAKQVAEHVRKLNSQNDMSIATVWELVILNVLSKIGEVQYEREFKGQKKPDIFFESSSIHPFVADITAISDNSYERDNPIRYFNKCLNDFFSKKGLTMAGLNLDFKNEKIGVYGDSKTKISLPNKKDIPVFIKKELFPIREKIKLFPNKAFKTVIKKGNASFSIIYNPQSKYFIENHASYTVPYSLTKNPIYNRLKKKADQLRKSGYVGVMGIFVCDGECNSLNYHSYCTERFSQNDIIQEIFRINTTLSFVVVLSLEETHNTWRSIKKIYIKVLYYFNKKAKFPISQNFFQELFQMEEYLPIPESMPVNAKTYMNSRKHKGLSYYGGFTMNESEIKISSRMITKFLAGVLDFEKFDIDHKQMSSDNKNMIKDFFLRQSKQGSMIENISIEKCQDKDDDWIKFKYGHSDAAVSKYK